MRILINFNGDFVRLDFHEQLCTRASCVLSHVGVKYGIVSLTRQGKRERARDREKEKERKSTFGMCRRECCFIRNMCGITAIRVR